jgi:dsDNA-specific endonuclease/ATPase MutS2
MNPKQRLADLEEILDSLYETLGNAQKRRAFANDVFEKDGINQRLRKEVLPEISKNEMEYWKLLEQEASTGEVAEADASQAIVEVVPKVAQIVNTSNTKYPDELMQKLQEILDTLNEQERPATNKLIAALPVIPGIISYQLEIDTEISLKMVFEGIRQLVTNAIKKNTNRM